MAVDFPIDTVDVESTASSTKTKTSSFSSTASSSTSSKHLISIESLVINKELGAGEFGVVQQGVWTNEETGERTQVAIKCLSKQRMQNNSMEFLKEAAMMHSIDHEYIVRLYGVVMDIQNLMLVTELAPLRSLLECLKEPSLKESFPVISLCEFSSQIADGMAYLESKRLIHRDLAARNILVFARNKIKISDFGLSRALGVGKDYYQTNFNVNLKLPIAWCAPECINFLKFTSASDVWAYGVTLWEMFSYGFQPWAALTGQQILQAIDSPNFQRLEQPDSCPKEYYSLMLKCWEHEPCKRPHFYDIVKMLPDCRPELVQVVKNCPSDVSIAGRKDHLVYKIGDIITVLDKHPIVSRHMSLKSNASSTDDISLAQSHDAHRILWKGSLVSGKTGLFDPSNTVTHLGALFPAPIPAPTNTIVSSTSSHSAATASSNGSSNGHSLSHHHGHGPSSSNPLSANFLRGIVEKFSNTTSGIYSSKRKLKRDMISMPQPDFKHTGHVGVDGAFFGDISFLGDKYTQIQQQKSSLPHGSNLARSPSDLSDKAPLLLGHKDPFDSKYHASAANPIVSGNLSLKDLKIRNLTSNASSHAPGDHEYHEIVNDCNETADFSFLESPHFETIDFGPSLLDEVCRELDIITKPNDADFNDHQQELMNECSSNVKNEIKEIVAKFPLINKSEGKKKQATVKPISPDDEESLNSAIAMAKELASRSILEYDGRLDNAAFECPSSADSPKTPNSPNKKSSKFSFKFHSKSSPKTEKRSFTEEAERISNLQSIISQEAKEAYSSLIEKKSSVNSRSNSICNSSSLINSAPPPPPPPPPPPGPALSSTTVSKCEQLQSNIVSPSTLSPGSQLQNISTSVKPVATVIANTSSIGHFGQQLISQPTATKIPSSSVQHIRAKSEDATFRNDEGDSNDANPLRMLRAGGVTAFSKVRGNKQRLSSSLRVTGPSSSSVTRSSLGTPPPVPTVPIASSSTSNIANNTESNESITVTDQSGHLTNALPLPPRDRNTSVKVPLKHHQRKHPLLLPGSQSEKIAASTDVLKITSGHQIPSQHLPVLSTFRPAPVLKQVSCPEPPSNFVISQPNGSNTNVIAPASTTACVATDLPATNGTKGHIARMPVPPPPKPIRDPAT